MAKTDIIIAIRIHKITFIVYILSVKKGSLVESEFKSSIHKS